MVKLNSPHIPMVSTQQAQWFLIYQVTILRLEEVCKQFAQVHPVTDVMNMNPQEHLCVEVWCASLEERLLSSSRAKSAYRLFSTKPFSPYQRTNCIICLLKNDQPTFTWIELREACYWSREKNSGCQGKNSTGLLASLEQMQYLVTQLTNTKWLFQLCEDNSEDFFLILVLTKLPGLALNCNSSASASRAARVTGMSHLPQLLLGLFVYSSIEWTLQSGRPRLQF